MLRGAQFALGIAVIFTTSLFASAQPAPQKSLEPSPTKDRPIIEVDLHKFADANWNPNNGDKPGSTIGSAIRFANATSLVWIWWTRDSVLPRSMNNSVPPQTTRIHAVLLEALTGEARAKKDWPVLTSAVRYEIVQDGNFLTCIDDKIRLFSPEFQLLREAELAPPYVCTPSAHFRNSRISPTGRSILFAANSGKSKISEVLDTHTLKPVSSANEGKAVTIMSISDHRLTGFCGNSGQVCIRDLDGLWRAFSFTGPGNQPATSVLGPAYFVNDDTV